MKYWWVFQVLATNVVALDKRVWKCIQVNQYYIKIDNIYDAWSVFYSMPWDYIINICISCQKEKNIFQCIQSISCLQNYTDYNLKVIHKMWKNFVYKEPTSLGVDSSQFSFFFYLSGYNFIRDSTFLKNSDIHNCRPNCSN